ncbi:mCG146331, partial [Mus musculus]
KQRHSYTRMFIAALCIITEACRQPKCYSVGEWLSCLMGYYTDAEEQVIAITTEESEKQWVLPDSQHLLIQPKPTVLARS